ncbi:hypothetical protein [Alkalihalobacillus sp. AL-G]|uniref:hypothetical protein n=1 Tax=Alkalihalobacillus sp. AL-G TaxID=2926399 RepID=UPI00272A0341|nr:hypothetical protein [Alkalihalobacillus sp. AL-G]WLD93782.1 hypothetical protein MOJ78_02380 [Alkalihalobacillus sp. AL-G]
MEGKLNKQLEILKNSVIKEDFIDIAYDVTEEIESYENAFDAIEPILKLVEQNPEVDFGSPGPLVHFVEQFHGNFYEEKLVQSIQRYPTSHTLWMLNRIINGSQGEQKKYYLNVLQNVLNSPNVSNQVSSLAKEFLSLHS